MKRVADSWSQLHAHVHQRLRRSGLLPPQAKILIAVSGGQDSLCLLKLLLDLQRQWPWQIAVVHCDHRWRDDSTANADFVEQLCDRWQVTCHRLTATTPPTTEAAARQWRYREFATLAIAQGYSHVVTGHTATDRAETLIYNLMRGSGMDGLAALVWQRSLSPDALHIQLVRPLLDVTRADTARFCATFELPVWEDRTNQDRTYARNRIRLDLLPYLQANFNPAVETTLAQTAEILTAEVEVLQQMAADLVRAIADTSQPPHHWQISQAQLQAVPLAIQRRVMRQILQTLVPSQVTFEQVEKLVGLIHAPNRSRSDPFPGGAIATVLDRTIVIHVAE